MPKITVDLTDEQHRRFVNAKMDRKEKSLQSLLISATESLISGPVISSTENRQPPESTASELDERYGILLRSEGREPREMLIAREEWHWVERVLGVVRGKVEQAIKPLDTNLDSFCYLTELALNVEHGGAAPVPHTEADKQSTIAQLRRNKEAIERRLEELARSGTAGPRKRKAAGEARSPVRGGRR